MTDIQRFFDELTARARPPFDGHPRTVQATWHDRGELTVRQREWLRNHPDVQSGTLALPQELAAHLREWAYDDHQVIVQHELYRAVSEAFNRAADQVIRPRLL